MLDIDIPEGALAPSAEQALIVRLTDVLLQWEGVDPRNQRARSLAWVFVNRPQAVYVAGALASAPRYRVFARVPEGQFDDERRAGMVAAVTEAILDAEEGRYPREGTRVWVFPNEIPEGTWGGNGRVWRRADIGRFVFGKTDENGVRIPAPEPVAT